MDQPQYYMYTYTADANATAGIATGQFESIANGDLNGDGTLSTFQISGMLQKFTFVSKKSPNNYS